MIKAGILSESFNLTVIFKKNSINGEFGMNISVLLTSKSQEIKGEQNLVFMGFGINLPDKGINDYEGINV